MWRKKHSQQTLEKDNVIQRMMKLALLRLRLSQTQLVGHLTKGELLAVLPGQCMTWSYIPEVLGAQSNEILSVVQQAKEEKEAKLQEKCTHKQRKRCHYLAAQRQNEGGSTMEGGDDVNVDEAL
ncbi:hypothetical protein PAXRUDRAFT_28842 [Paxillus rubicundulus Ve08.2h10]|uniref:Uncharacterized protein n=1 Tax=Paxillus rubicundulus Ve08.2h10 TaxID=930991 RepID=A0A0D0D9R7_9AGAM|nr:hypothetical protein PAXRUDRAFT_28842 [Paxillus rubicundulus Ve08.2h10]